MSDNDKWITDRRPTEEDGDWFWVTDVDGKRGSSWRYEVGDKPWIAKPLAPKPYVKPEPLRRTLWILPGGLASETVCDVQLSDPSDDRYKCFQEVKPGDIDQDVMVDVLTGMKIESMEGGRANYSTICRWIKQLEGSKA